VGQAALTFLGVVLGAVIGGGVTLWQTYLAAQREREGRQIERAQGRKDAHDAFQRDAILALQSALEDYWQVVTDWLNQVTGATTAEGEQPPTRPPYELRLRTHAASGRLASTRAHVFDDELRRLAKRVDHQGIFVTAAKSVDLKRKGWSNGADELEKFHDRVNVLLRDLFSTG
jgi:hypothetical protein